MSHTAPSPVRPAGRLLVVAAAAATAIDVVLAAVVLGHLVGLHLIDTELFRYYPLAVLFAIAAVVIPAVLVATRLRSRAKAWLLIGLVGAGCFLSAAQAGWDSLAKDRAHDRHLREVSALAGLHGERGGVHFEILPGDRVGIIQLRVKVDDEAVGPTVAAERWSQVFCDATEVQAVFGNDARRLSEMGGPPSRVRQTAAGAVFALQFSSAHSPRAANDLSEPYCSFIVKDPFPGTQSTIFNAHMHR